MISLEDGMLLYYGSYTCIPHIDFNYCTKGLDFGHGFYLTSSYEQAYNYVKQSVGKAKRIGVISDSFDVKDGKVSVYKFHYAPNLFTYCFQEASVEWLHFVSANRKKDLFPELLKKFRTVDIIAGKIADDQTARTLQLYINGAYGEPGIPETDKVVIKKLLPNRLKDQYCFRTEDAIKHLEFIRSESYGNNK